MSKHLLLSFLFFGMLFSACKKENTALPEPAEQENIDRTEADMRVSRINTFFAQTIGSLTLSSTASSYANSSAVLACPESDVNGDVLNMQFGGGVNDPCDIGNGTMIGGNVDLYRGSTGNLLNTCPGPYTKGSLVFDNLFVAGCFVNVENNGDWDNLVFYAKDNCEQPTAAAGQQVDFKFLASPTYSLNFTDGSSLNVIDPIISTSGPLLVVKTTVPDEDLFNFNTLYNLEYKLHIPFVNNYGTNNYFTTLTMYNLPTLQQDLQVGIYTALGDELCYRPFASKFITQGTLYGVDLQNPDPAVSVTTYDFGSDANGDDLGEDDSFVKVCYNEKVGPPDNFTIVQVCKIIECFAF